MTGKLIKINILALFAGMLKINRRKTKKVTKVFIILLAIYVIGVLLITFGVFFYFMVQPLFLGGLSWLYFALMGLCIFVLCFIGSVFMVQPQIFETRDSELLLSMPLKPSAILTGRIFALLIIEYVFEAFIIIPAFAVLIVSGYISHLSIIGIIFFFASAVLLPLVALAAGCLVGWLVAIVTSRMRRKNVITLVLSIAFLAVFIWGYYKIVGNMSLLMENGAEIAEAVRRAVFPAYHLGVAISDGKALSFLIFAVFAIVPYVLMHTLLSVSFMKLATRGRGAKKIEYREKALRASGARAALLVRELRFFFSFPMYIINATLGSIATLAIAVVLVIRPQLLTDPIAQLAMFLPSVDFGFIGAVALSALAALNTVSSPSISLEGKSLWIVKSLPVQARDVLLTKVWLHIIVCGAPSFLAGVICLFSLHLHGAAQIALTLIMPASVTLLFSLFGVVLNLMLPRLDWINPIQPVKQGASTMLVLFGGMALILALALLYGFALSTALSLNAFLFICTAVFIAASAGLYVYLGSGGCRKFNEL